LQNFANFEIMQYTVFERIMSKSRMSRYMISCSNDTRKAMTLYRLNLKLSQELFTIISCFEVALRNSIDSHYTRIHGDEWLKESVESNGMFENRKCVKTANIINRALRKLDNEYAHSKLIAEMDFGFWRYLFSRPQFYAGGQSLLGIFPAKPTTTPTIQYNHKYVFNELERINKIRNRIAHHEPVCFKLGNPIIDTTYAKQKYRLIKDLFSWMQIDESALLYGIDHVNKIVQKIDDIKPITR